MRYTIYVDVILQRSYSSVPRDSSDCIQHTCPVSARFPVAVVEESENKFQISHKI